MREHGAVAARSAWSTTWRGCDVRQRRRGRLPRDGRRQDGPPRSRADPAGKKVFDKPIPNSEPKLRAVFDKLKAKFGTVLVIVDQPASIGALPLTVARDTDCEVAYLPGLAMRRIADLTLSAFAFACMNADPTSRTYYDRQRAHGKTHTQALLRLARQRISVLFAMLRDGTFYESRVPTITLAA
jgi:hypothetical protein